MHKPLLQWDCIFSSFFFFSLRCCLAVGFPVSQDKSAAVSLPSPGDETTYGAVSLGNNTPPEQHGSLGVCLRVCLCVCVRLPELVCVRVQCS